MIVISILLILVAIVLLVLGLMSASSLLLIGSIVGSLLAAVTLVVGMRQAAAARAEMVDAEAFNSDDVLAEADSKRNEYGDPAEDYLDEEFDGEYEGRRQRRESATTASTEFRDEEFAAYGASEPEPPLHREPPVRESAVPPPREPVEDPEDEPEPQLVSAGEAARIARLTTDVYVVDGRPRYHLAGCVHLMDKEAEPLPVNEAAELGFTPCGLCEPDSALLADARRV